MQQYVVSLSPEIPNFNSDADAFILTATVKDLGLIDHAGRAASLQKCFVDYESSPQCEGK